MYMYMGNTLVLDVDFVRCSVSTGLWCFL